MKTLKEFLINEQNSDFQFKLDYTTKEIIDIANKFKFNLFIDNFKKK